MFTEFTQYTAGFGIINVAVAFLQLGHSDVVFRFSLRSHIMEISRNNFWNTVKNIINAMEKRTGATNPPPRLLKLKIFLTIQKNLSIIGIEPNSQPFDAKILTLLLTMGAAIICLIMYIANEAKTLFQYMQSIYECSVLIVLFIALLITILNLSAFWKIIYDCESIANTSKCKVLNQMVRFGSKNKNTFFSHILPALKYSASQSIFNKTHQQMEKLSGILFFVLAKMTPGIISLLPSAYSFIIYFVTNSGQEAFILPFPMW